ncbi:V-type ATP synthase subunit F [Petrocella sp. FN5]|uniref:V-type ATP synthase subunit F n=1 Tax=Petrocella sp. FN5 TaxID=3032002 RepID=UPI0023DC819A|nr:V-type ATP synthase subunit F [Petrocella sp. FN5]MDF1616714.1 V-type ATP synthase subunit F [Petrocella sp. FN5]
MKMFLISDNIDTKTGMRLAGVSGVVVHKKEEVIEVFNDILKNPEVDIVLMTEKIALLIPEMIDDVRLNYQTPLIVEIPDRHGSERKSDSITRYVRDALGLKI